MRLPSKFFFRLDAHQATIMIGVFQFTNNLYYFLGVCNLQVWMEPENTDDLNDLEKDREVLEGLMHMATAFKYEFVIKLIIVACAIFAVLYRTRWLMLPWLALEVINTIGVSLAFIGSLAVFLSRSQTKSTGIFLMSTFFLSYIAFQSYSLLAAITCFQEIGAANQNTPNRDADLTVQFQPIDSNIGELV